MSPRRTDESRSISASRIVLFLGVALSATVLGFVAVKSVPDSDVVPHSKAKSALTSRKCEPASFQELVALPDDALGAVDIARANLLCAQGLPGAEKLNVETCLAALDRWAQMARRAEEKYRPQYFQNPDRYDRSIAKFRAVNLALTLKEEAGCSYNMELVRSGAMADVRSTRFSPIRATSSYMVSLKEGRAAVPPGRCCLLPWADALAIRFTWSPARDICSADGRTSRSASTSKLLFVASIHSPTLTIDRGRTRSRMRKCSQRST